MLVVDEPALGLAPTLVDEVYTRLTELAASDGHHDHPARAAARPRDVASPTSVVVLRDGVIVAAGNPEDDEFAATAEEAYFGEVSKALIEAES